MKKLSIITINLNNQSGLIKTIQSVISQTFKDFEWIIIDGDSTDGSKELLKKHIQHFTHCISEKDNGIYNAMNKGVKLAQGEYIYFLNSGDYLCNKDTLKNVFNRFITSDFINGNLILNAFSVNKRDFGIHSSHITCYDLFSGNLNHQSTFIKKDLFYKYGMYDENLKVVADWKFFFETIILHNCSVTYINQDIAYFDTTGISSKALNIIRKERSEYLNTILPQKVIEDYKFLFHINEIRKYRFSRALYSLLYRMVILYEKFKFNV
jgi:glycosyltransferase involved in cell wall biosynthesis